MKTKKEKIISFFLCFFIIVGALPVSAIAGNGMEIRVSSAECLPGETIVVTVDLINNPGLASLKLKVSYDDALSLHGVIYNTEMGGQSIQPQTMSSPATLMWVSPFSDYKSDTTFATLTFKVAENATPNTVADISLSYDPNDIYDMTETNLPCFVTNGKVSIGSLDGNDNEYITATEHSRIDYTNKIVFSDAWCEADIYKLVNKVGDCNIEVSPSFNSFIGTGSAFVVNKESSDVTYSVAIAGDVDGDSVCDVIDAHLTSLAVSEKLEFSDISSCAATLVADKDVDIYDYQNVVNWALNHNVKLNSSYTVTFEDYNGTELKTESVNSGNGATPPANPQRDGYVFVGWSKAIDNITEDTTVTAEYVKLDGPAFVVDYATAQAGAEDVAVTISLRNNPGIASVGMYVDFDSALTLTNIVYNSSIGGQAVPPQTFASPAKLTWVSPFADVNADDVFVTLYFSVDEAASGELPINLRYNENDVYDMTETNISFDVVNNSILVTK